MFSEVTTYLHKIFEEKTKRTRNFSHSFAGINMIFLAGKYLLDLSRFT